MLQGLLSCICICHRTCICRDSCNALKDFSPEIRDVSQVHGVSELVESRAGNPVCCGPDVETQGFRVLGVETLGCHVLGVGTQGFRGPGVESLAY